ncbi:MAG: Cof-type HAD-IIB family hydrolase [Lachnospiraceae bacterium]
MSALLFFDIDGTLLTLDASHEFPESTKMALLEAKKNGHKIFINTGRVKSAIDKQLLEFPFDGLVCGCGTYIEYQGQTLFHAQLDRKLCRAYAKEIHNWNLGTVYEGKNQMFIDGEHGPGSFLEFIYNYFGENSDLPIEDYTHPDLAYDKFTTSKVEGGDLESFIHQFGKIFHLIPHGENVIEAVPMGCSKATGIEFLLNYLKEDKENSYAFGDSINDMEMLEYAAHSIGMGNAVPKVKETVEFVTSDVTADGIYQAMKHYQLI